MPKRPVVIAFVLLFVAAAAALGYFAKFHADETERQDEILARFEAATKPQAHASGETLASAEQASADPELSSWYSAAATGSAGPVDPTPAKPGAKEIEDDADDLATPKPAEPPTTVE